MKIVTIYNFKDSDIVQNYLGFWGLPNDYDNYGCLRCYNSKEEAIKKLNKIRSMQSMIWITQISRRCNQ